MVTKKTSKKTTTSSKKKIVTKKTTPSKKKVASSAIAKTSKKTAKTATQELANKTQENQQSQKTKTASTPAVNKTSKPIKNSANKKDYTLSIRDDGVAVITIDVQNQKMNVLGESFSQDLLGLLKQINTDSNVKATIIVSGKPGSFIAGADIRMLNAYKTREDAQAMIDDGHVALNAIAGNAKPIVAAIHGLCLGGGCELSLACHARILSDDAKTSIGLPEVMLGVLPGLGGTQRLPRLIGIIPALEMILSGRAVNAKKAKRLKLADEVVPHSILHDAAAKKALSLLKADAGTMPFSRKILSYISIKGLQSLILEKNQFGRKFIFAKARKQTLTKTNGNYPAPERIIDVIEYGITRPLGKALQNECKHFCDLLMSPEAKELINIYFATTALKKETFIDSDAEPQKIHKLGILGGGLMGGGIAVVSLDKAKVIVRNKDISDQGIRSATKHIYDYYKKRIKRKAISKSDAAKKQLNYTGTLNYSGFKNADLVIEAVFEDLKIKHQVLKEVEALGNKKIIFASNTSSLRVRDIAKASKRPENIIGMHYFSPVEKMPLLEIIVHNKTADWVTRTCVDFGKKQGKTVIVVKDGAGFYINRILVPYMNEAAHLAMQGVPLDAIDKAIVAWGMPVGPIKLLDEVGIDIGAHMLPNVEAEFGARMTNPGFLNKLLEDGRLGKKAKKGFYDYSKQGKGKIIDQSIYTLLGVQPNKQALSSDEITERCMLPLINEAVRCLEDGTIRSTRDGDIGTIFGIGFPAFRGGPFRYIDACGVNVITDKLKLYESELGERFTPAKLLLQTAKKNERFYS